MPEEPDAIIAMLAEQILRYLDTHPKAADSREGIERWWLGGNAGTASPEAVQQALDALVAQGRVRRREVAGGEAIYSRAERGRNANDRE